MIDYTSTTSLSNLCNIWQLKGSVFPKAFVFALPAALVAVVLRGLMTEFEELMELPEVAKSVAQGAYSSFTFLLSFLLVFRTSQAYERFFSGAQEVHMMSARFYAAAGSLAAFSNCSRRPIKEVSDFQHRMVRLFSLLHCAAMQHVAVMEEEEFEVIDPRGLDDRTLQFLHRVQDKTRDATLQSQAESLCGQRRTSRLLRQNSGSGRPWLRWLAGCWKGQEDEEEGAGLLRSDPHEKVVVLFQWILQLVCDNLETGVLPIPTPIVSRIFQELSHGMGHLSTAAQISEVAFPFPYAQMTILLLVVHWCLTPAVSLLVSTTYYGSAVFVFVATFGLWALNFIAAEIEQPFGDDENDLPARSMQRNMNRSLFLLLERSVRRVPQITPQAVKDLEQLRTAPAYSLNQANAILRAHYASSSKDSFFQLERSLEEEERMAATHIQRIARGRLCRVRTGAVRATATRTKMTRQISESIATCFAEAKQRGLAESTLSSFEGKVLDRLLLLKRILKELPTKIDAPESVSKVVALGPIPFRQRDVWCKNGETMQSAREDSTTRKYDIYRSSGKPRSELLVSTLPRKGPAGPRPRGPGQSLDSCPCCGAPPEAWLRRPLPG